MSKNVQITIDNVKCSVPEGMTILNAALQNNIRIPNLCYHQDLCIAGNCRICLVDIEGSGPLQVSCATMVRDGLVVRTNTARVRKARKDILALLLAEHNTDCLHCDKNGKCELQKIAEEWGSESEPYISLIKEEPVDISSPAIKKDDSKCIRCQRCVRTCEELQGVNALAVVNKGGKLKISTFMDKPLHYVVCTNCGQCVNRCPTGALVEQNYTEKVWSALNNPDRHVVVQTAPAVRVAIGEELGFEPGHPLTGKMVSALRRLGFDKVFDTNFTADLTIMEEGTELLQRLKAVVKDKKNAALPQLSSCSPGWIKYIEHQYPQLLDNLSSCKSPQQMFGALAKTYYAKIAGIDPAKITVVSVMPCTAKKFEAQRPEMMSSGFQDVDYVLTTRELARMIMQAGISFSELEETACDSLLGLHSGAAVIFGATGGVMEAALRTAYELVTGREVPFKDLDITPVRGMEGVKEASIVIKDCLPDWKFLENVTLKVAVAHGLANARILMDAVAAGKANYHFIEIMACPGGCLGGGGQPIPTTMDIRKKRMLAIYAEDAAMPIRKSHENPEIVNIYKNFLGHPCSHLSHELLHTHYTER
ncbi:MAG: iron hydrogenase small subunit [Spirochaetales bacterium]|nr:iron hydrogenase small subunit [Spirochaetales bacterium]